MYAEHAKSGSNPTTANITPSLDDVRLAVQARTEGASVPKEVNSIRCTPPTSCLTFPSACAQFLLQLATTVNANPLPPVPEVYGIRLPPPAQRLTAPNFTLVPRSAKPPAPPALTGFDNPLPAAAGLGGDSNFGTGTGAMGTAEPTPAAAQDDDDDDSEGLFGDDVSGDDDDDDDDEDMEDVTAGMGGSGAMDGGQNGLGGGEGAAGQKRKADSDDEEYD